MTFDTKIKEFPGVGQTAEDLMPSAELVARAGNVDRTIEFCNQALTKNMEADRTAALVMMRGNAYLKKGDLENALHDYGEAATLDPNKVQGYIRRAIVFARKKDYASATNELDAIAPRNPRPLDAALNSVAWIRATYPEANLRNGKKAIEAAERACELSQWKIWGYIDTLAAAYAEAGEFDQAVKYETQAFAMMTADDSRHQSVQQRVELFKQHKPYRESPPGS